MTSNNELYESRTSGLYFHDLTVTHILPHQKALNKSHSAAQSGNFDIVLKIPTKTHVITKIKHCIKCCTLTISNFTRICLKMTFCIFLNRVFLCQKFRKGYKFSEIFYSARPKNRTPWFMLQPINFEVVAEFRFLPSQFIIRIS